MSRSPSLDGSSLRYRPCSVDAEIEQRCELDRLLDAVGQLALDGDILEVGRHLVEDEGHIRAGQRNLDDLRSRCEVEERKAGALSYHLAATDTA